jgi:hypothetical protein
MATLDPGVEQLLPKAEARGIYAVVLDGYVEVARQTLLDKGRSIFVKEGGDAMSRLESAVRIPSLDREWS